MIRLGKWVNALLIMGLTNLFFMLRIWLRMSPLPMVPPIPCSCWPICGSTPRRCGKRGISPGWGHAGRRGSVGNRRRYVYPQSGIDPLLRLSSPGNPLPASTFSSTFFSWLLYTVIVIINGFLRMYATSLQLGIKWRVVFSSCGGFLWSTWRFYGRSAVLYGRSTRWKWKSRS